MRKALSREQVEQLEKVVASPDEQFGAAGIPEAPAENRPLVWRGDFADP